MSSVYTPSAVTLGNITLTSDGDARNAASINVPIQAVADGVKFADTRSTPLADLTALAALLAPADGTVRHVLGFGWYVFKTSAATGLSPFRVAATDTTPGGWVSSTAHQTTLARICSPLQTPIYQTSAAQAPAASSADTPNLPVFGTSISISSGPIAKLLGVTTGSAIAHGYRFPLRDSLVDGATLLSAVVRLRGIGGHGALPLLMPKVGIHRADIDGFGNDLLLAGVVADTSASVAAYEASHDVTFTPNQNNVIDSGTYTYWLTLWNEGSTSALTGLEVHGWTLNMSSIPDARRS